MLYRYAISFRKGLIFGFALAAALVSQAPAFAAANLTIAPISWNIVGLDSNNVNVGPNNFPVGARVCNTGDAAATNVTSTYVWDSADPYINLRPGTLTSYTGADAVASLAPGTCHDFYYEVTITRDPLAYNHTRRYHITATADTLGTVSTPTPRELFVEHLVSQSRNHILDVKLNDVLVPAGGTMALVVGQTYKITLDGATATNGYEQLESFINFPNTIFQVLSVSTTYTADTTPPLSPNDKLYGDACKWENDPNSPYYRSCLDVGKVGGNVTVDYMVKILQVPGPPLTNPEPLGSLIYDFSGSSYHYNSDFGISTRFADVIDPSTLTISKSFNPTPTTVNGVSALTFTLFNPNSVPLSGLSFTDTFPASPGAMVVASSPGATTNGCGTPVFAPVAGASSISFTNGSIAANGTCTVKVNVTAPVTGTYNNTSDHLFLGTADTGNFATATLTVNNNPPPPTPTCGLPLAQWIFPTGFSTTSPAPYAPNTTVTASASAGAGINPIESSQNHTVTPAGTASWGSNGGFDSTGALNTSFNDYFQFAIDTTGLTSVDLSFWARRPNGNSPTGVAVYYGTSASPPGTLLLSLPQAPATAFPSAANAWESSGTITVSTGLNPSGLTYFRIYGFNAKNNNPGSDLYLDDVTFTGCGTPQTPTLSKAFAPGAVAVNGTSTLTFTITNPNPTVALSGVSFTDTLPSGLTVTSGTSSQCGGTLTRTAPSTLSFAGGTLAAGASCTVTATVTATTAGPHDNVSGFVSSTQSGTNNGATGIATASLTAVLPPVIAKQFAPNPILAGGVSTLTFTITNPNQNQALSGVAFTDSFPTSPGSMVVAASPSPTISAGCGGPPTFAPSAGAGTITFSGGTIAGGDTCTVTVNVTAPVAGTYSNTSGAVSHIINAAVVNGNSASDSLTVTPATPAIALLKQVGPTASGPWSSFLAVAPGGNVFYRFTVENIGNVPLSSVGVTDPQVSTASCTWPEPLPVASPTQDPTATCVVGPIAAATGTNPNTATASGTFSATTVNDTSTATYATTGLTITKNAAETSFSAAGDVLHYTFVVTNSGFAPLAGPVTVADDKATDESCPDVSTVGDLDNFLDPGESVTCTATYTTTGADVAAGSVTNQASATAGGVTSNTATKTVPGPVAPPVISKAFSPNPIAVGGVSTLTFTITNPNAGTALTGVAFTDSLPAGTAVAATPSASTSGCGSPTFAPAAGNTSLSFSGGTIAISGTCTVSVSITATTSGAKANTTGAVTSTNGGTGNTGSDTLNVLSPPSISKAFSPNSISVGGVSTLTFTITNPNAGTALTGVAFTDSLPAGTAVAATPNASTSGCGSPTFAPAAGNTSLSFSGGTIAISGTCTVSVDITATTTGAKANTTGNVTSTNGGTGNTGSDTLNVLSPPSISKAFSPNPISVGGVSTLTFTITNPNAGTALTGVAFTDSLPAGTAAAATPNASTSGCGSPTFAPAAGNTSLSFSGGTIAISGTCTVSVDITATTNGAKANTTGNVTSTNGGTGNTGSDTLNVLSPPSISKAFSPNPIAIGGVSTLTFTITNPNAGTSLTGVAFTDSLPAGTAVAATPSASASGCGAPTFAPAAGNTTLTFSGGTIAASGTCTVSVSITATTAGAKANTTGSVTSTNGGTGNTGSDTLTVLSPPSISKAFSPNPIAIGGVSTLTFTITNANAGTSLTGAAFTDALPAGTAVAATPNASASGCGSPTFAPAAGNTALTFSGGTIAASGTCTVSVSITATTSGAKANTTGNVTSTNGGTGNTGSDTLTVLSPPSISKAFSPNPIAVGGTSTLTFTITNPNAGTALTGVAFTDSFPAGMEVAATPSASTSGCGSPTFAPAAGNTSLSFSGGTIAISGTCTVSVSITATTGGAKANTTGNVTSTNGGTGNTGSDTLTVLSPPSISKAFSPSSIAIGGTSTLTFTITNPNAGTALTGVAFTDSFPAGMEVATTPSASTSGCGSPTFAPAAGNTSLSFSGGTIAPSGTCTVSVSITATTSGAKANTTGNVTSTNGGTGNTGSDTLNVSTLSAPSISKAFSPNPIAVGGVSTLTFTITNANSGTALNGVAFTDSFPAGMEVAATPNASTSGCGSPTFAPAAGNTSLSFSGGTILANGTCTVSVSVTATTSGAKTNTTGAVTSTNGGTGNTGSDTLTVLSPPSIAKAFSPNPIAIGGVSTLTFTITNANSGTALNGVAFTDLFPAGMEVAATPSVSTSGCGSPTFTPAAGDTTLTFSGGTIAASGTCTVSVAITATTSGAKANTTGSVTSTNGGTGNTGSDTLTVLAPLSISKVFSPNPVAVGGVSTLTFTITNGNAGTAQNGVAFTDPLPASMAVAATPNVSTTGCGSPTFAPVAGDTTLAFSGGTIAPSSTCTVTVDVTVTTSGAKVNTTSAVTSTNGGTGNTGTDTLTVLAPPSIGKAFSPASIAVGGVSTLTFTITNPNTGTALNGIAFTDSLPAGMAVAATPGAGTTGCGSPTFAPVAGDTTLTFSGGTIAASGTCTVTVSVTATSSGSKVNTTGNVTSTNGGSGNTGTATLSVSATAPLVTATKSSSFNLQANDLDHSGTLTPGDTLLYTVQINNTGTADALSVTFTDTPDANTTLVAGSVTTSQGTVTQGNLAGDTAIAVNIGTLPPQTPVTVSFLVKLNNPFPAGVTTISNQGVVKGSNMTDVSTDDPGTAPNGDPTVNVVAAPVPPIPTLSGWGLALLILLLAIVAAVRLRRRPEQV